MQKDIKLVIIDYGLSNLYSVVRACEILGLKPILTEDSQELKTADAVILPGVGAFNAAMINLERLGFVEAINEYAEEKKPLMGVCLGLQLLFQTSDEFGNHNGLGLIEGTVKKFPTILSQNVKVPQIGWNTIRPQAVNWNETPLRTIASNAFMYFVHSYYVDPTLSKYTLTTTTYGETTYCSSIIKDNIFATQFHPEKSGPNGLSIYQNWLENIN